MGDSHSSHQVEGNNTNNNWWPGSKSRGASVMAINPVWPAIGGEVVGVKTWIVRKKPGRTPTGYRSNGAGCSQPRTAGTRTHRPVYRHLARPERARHDPLVTLHHVTDPLWLGELGGWESDKVVELFAAYVERVVEATREYANLWVTINEPNILVVSPYIVEPILQAKRAYRLRLGWWGMLCAPRCSLPYHPPLTASGAGWHGSSLPALPTLQRLVSHRSSVSANLFKLI